MARSTGLALRILELGTSAGLNLRWDNFRYEARGPDLGDPASPVRLCDYNSDRPLPFVVGAEVVERAGCDVAPVDPTSEDGLRTLLAYEWPDQPDRLRRLRGAVAVARRVPARVEQSEAAEWLDRAIEKRSDGIASVVFHSIFWTYLSEQMRARITDLVEPAEQWADGRVALAWLRMEPAGDEASVRLRIWPGGEDQEIARSGYHGAHVRWLL